MQIPNSVDLEDGRNLRFGQPGQKIRNSPFSSWNAMRRAALPADG